MLITATMNEDSERLGSILETKQIQRVLQSGDLTKLRLDGSQSWGDSEPLGSSKTRKTPSSGRDPPIDRSRILGENEEIGRVSVERKIKSEAQLKSATKLHLFGVEYPRVKSLGQKPFSEWTPSGEKDHIRDLCKELGLSISNVTHDLRHEQHLLCECRITSVRNQSKTGVLLQSIEVCLGRFQ